MSQNSNQLETLQKTNRDCEKATANFKFGDLFILELSHLYLQCVSTSTSNTLQNQTNLERILASETSLTLLSILRCEYNPTPPPPRSPKHTHMQCTLLKSSLVALISFQVLFSSWMQMQKNSSKERSCVKNMGWKSWQFSLAVDTKKGKGCHLKFGSSLNET